MPNIPVSCFIIAKNEADRLARTIRSVHDWVDEVIVIDSGSTDGTQELAAAEGARVVFNAWPGFGPQKRFGESQCRNDWIWNIDADEVVPPALAREIVALFAIGEPDRAAYWVPDNIVYPGHDRPRPLARDNRFIRLYDRRRARFKESPIFDSVDPGAEPTGHLSAALHHFTARSFDDLIVKCNERTRYKAQFWKPKPRAYMIVRLFTEFPLSFLDYYFRRTHVTGGVAGFKWAMILAFFRFARIVRLIDAGQGETAAELNQVRTGITAKPPTPR